MIKKGCRTRTKDDSDVQIIRQELKKKKKKNYISGSSGNGVQHGRKDEREI